MSQLLKHFRLAKIIFRINYSYWNHYSILLYTILGLIISAVIQIFTVNSIGHGAGNTYISKIFSGTLVALFTVFIINIGWIIYDNSGRELKSGEYLKYFSGIYNRKNVIVAKIITIYAEFLLFIIVSLLTLIISMLICLNIHKIDNFHFSYFVQYIEYICFFGFTMFIVGSFIFIPTFLYICYKFQTYWFAVSLVIFEFIGFLPFVVSVFVFLLLPRSSGAIPSSTVNNVKLATIILGAFSPYYMCLFFGSLILPKDILTNSESFLNLILGLLPKDEHSSTAFTQTETTIFISYIGIMLVAGFGFLLWSQNSLYKHKWFI